MASTIPRFANKRLAILNCKTRLSEYPKQNIISVKFMLLPPVSLFSAKKKGGT